MGSEWKVWELQKEQQEQGYKVSGADSRSGSNTTQIRRTKDIEIETKPMKRQRWEDTEEEERQVNT